MGYITQSCNDRKLDLDGHSVIPVSFIPDLDYHSYVMYIVNPGAVSEKPGLSQNNVFAIELCNNQFPQRWESPQGLADLGSAIGLAPQSPGLLGGLRDGTGVSSLIF